MAAAAEEDGRKAAKATAVYSDRAAYGRSAAGRAGGVVISSGGRAAGSGGQLTPNV